MEPLRFLNMEPTNRSMQMRLQYPLGPLQMLSILGGELILEVGEIVRSFRYFVVQREWGSEKKNTNVRGSRRLSRLTWCFKYRMGCNSKNQMIEEEERGFVTFVRSSVEIRRRFKFQIVK